MADEPTWDDLFGEPLPPKTQPTAPTPPVAQPPAQQAPAQPAAPQQVPPSPGAPLHYPPTQSPQTLSTPIQAIPTTPAPGQPASASPVSNYPAVTTGTSAPQPTYQVPAQAQPTYASTIKPPTYTPPPVPPVDTSRRGAGSRGGSARGGYRPGKPPRKLTWLWILIVLFVLGAGGAGVVYAAFGPQIRHVMGWEPSIDYSGSGNGQVADITILPGQYGSDVANSLAKAGVTKTSAAFYDLLLKQKKAVNFEPGTYKLQKQMSAQSALTAISNPANRVVSKVVIPEGFTLTQILARLSSQTGVKLADLQAAAKDYQQFKLPAGAPSLEGFLFPATYEFNPDTSAVVELQTMVTRMDQAFVQHKIAPADELKVITLASIIQKEGGTTADFYKVSRVFTNRLASNIPLESDATVSYGAGTSTIATTAAQRADASNLYNTYVHSGLPIGPISSPGDTAIDAALHPVAGPWIYFVLVNGYTGETVYSTTLAGQDAGIKQWQAWLKAHPGYGQ